MKESGDLTGMTNSLANYADLVNIAGDSAPQNNTANMTEADKQKIIDEGAVKIQVNINQLFFYKF